MNGLKRVQSLALILVPVLTCLRPRFGRRSWKLLSDAVASGTCAENVAWVLDDEGTLTSSGSGDMVYDKWGAVQSSGVFS